ncbi:MULTISPECIES: hypothetical protein [Moorena]|uniref:hypothetical protein n=1 Tax=Moorena TaxID=1155738 RepID=UPI00031FFFF1|nr:MULTISPECIES: hypothetical protein [Moorena]NEP36368.1 hypothetical protein [Moorena sp. SIO3B2]NEQ10300.1 hypothetical protein [Moorena sp. SIO4E2]NES44909.1 hypothetical protein [Moorena sp. SIO2C4]NET69366.1 hypothetical protein [Moorena sp. SIO1G6]
MFPLIHFLEGDCNYWENNDCIHWEEFPLIHLLEGDCNFTGKILEAYFEPVSINSSP